MMRMQFYKSILLYFLFCSYLSKAIANESNIPEGTIKLIIQTYIDDLIESTNVIDEILKSKLLMLSDHIVTHPALHQNRFHVGPEPPNYEPTNSSPLTGNLNRVNKKSNSMLVKRQNPNISVEQLRPDDENRISDSPPDEICSTNRYWEEITRAIDTEGRPVEIVQGDGLKQFIYTYRCANKKPCMGISPMFKSECTERYGFVTLYYRPLIEGSEKRNATWGPVRVPHHCACAVQRLYESPIDSLKKKRQFN